jgi:hypothetical protein
MMQLFTEEGWSIVTNKKRVGLLLLVDGDGPDPAPLVPYTYVYRTPKMLICYPLQRTSCATGFQQEFGTPTGANARKRRSSRLPSRLCLLPAEGTRRNPDSVVPDLLCDHRNNKLRG